MYFFKSRKKGVFFYIFNPESIAKNGRMGARISSFSFQYLSPNSSIVSEKAGFFSALKAEEVDATPGEVDDNEEEEE